MYGVTNDVVPARPIKTRLATQIRIFCRHVMDIPCLRSDDIVNSGGMDRSKMSTTNLWNRFILDICTRLTPNIFEKDDYAHINVLKHLI